MELLVINYLADSSNFNIEKRYDLPKTPKVFRYLLPQFNQDENVFIYQQVSFKSLFLPRVAEFIYIEGDNRRVSSAGII